MNKKNESGFIKAEIHKRLTGEMNFMPFAKEYIVLKTQSAVTHWVKVSRIVQLREKLLEAVKDAKPKVAVLFSADGFNYEVTNADIIQFLTEVHLAERIDGEA